MPAQLQAGVARAVITPPVGSTWMGGYAARKQPSQGIHDDLFASALVVDDGSDAPGCRAAIVTVDVLYLSAEQTEHVRKLIEEQGAVSSDAVMICASHTHGGPGMIRRRYGTPNETYCTTLVQQLAGVVY